MSPLHLPPPLTQDDFLKHYWQRQPLFMPAALPGYRSPVSPEELAGIACEEEVESRLILEHGIDGWELRHGPFDETVFTQLPESHWTLLVQDMDKHLPQAAELLQAIDFIPRWRVDDVMISYAADQGTVGPHTDAYDVFLVQAAGARRWRISHREYGEDDLLPDIDLRVLKSFETDQEWVLKPGDVLYLPPGVAHWGIAEGPCMTCSVGFRAPAERELVADWCEQLIDSVTGERHYTDPALSTASANGEISGAVLTRVSGMLQAAMQRSETDQARWFGRYITEPKPHLPVTPADIALPEEQLLELHATQGLMRNPCGRLAFAESAGQLYLFADGQDIAIPASLRSPLTALTEQATFSRLDLSPWLDNAPGREIVKRLYDQGSLVPFDEDE